MCPHGWDKWTGGTRYRPPASERHKPARPYRRARLRACRGTVPIPAHKLPPSHTGDIFLDTPTPTPTCPAAQNYNYTVGTGSYLAGTTSLGINCDDCSAPVPFPFPVKIYDTTYTSALAGSNGELGFGTDFSGFSVTCMPMDSATYTIGPLWVDQTRSRATAPRAACSTRPTGTAPNRTFVIEWRNIYYGFPFSPTPTLNYEVIFNEATALTGRFDVLLQHGEQPHRRDG